MNKFRAIRFTAMALVFTISLSIVFGVSAFSQTEYSVGDTVEYGSYPQTHITDETTIAELNVKITDAVWTDYGYYYGNDKVGSEEQHSFMFYTDTYLGGEKYRAVKFTSYRPKSTYYVSKEAVQYKCGYFVNIVYWFKFEPVKWTVLDLDPDLDPDTKSGLLISQKVIDTQPYNNIYTDVNKYSDSTISTYINDKLSADLFTSEEYTAIKSVSLPSSTVMTTETYGFVSSMGVSNTRLAVNTDYCNANGLEGHNISDTSNTKLSNYWTDEPSTVYDNNANYVTFTGKITNEKVTVVGGIRPCIYADLNSVNKYSLTYNVNGTQTVKMYSANETVTPYIPEITGYDFVKWDSTEPTVMPSHNVTLTAETSIHSHDLILKANGGTFADNTDQKKSTLSYNNPVSVEKPSRDGYTFSQWDKTVPTTMPDNDVELVAEWTANQGIPYTINTYKEKLDGTYDLVTETLYGSTDSPITVNPETVEGFTLNTEKSNSSCLITADGKGTISLYYDRNSYKATWKIGENETYRLIKYGDEIKAPEIPSVIGKTAHWDNEIPNVMPASELTFTAVYDDCIHNYVLTDKKAPTCTESGFNTYKCSICNQEKAETINALGHTAGEAVKENETAAGCKTEGKYDSVIYCSVCGEEISRETIVIPALGHIDANGDDLCDRCGEDLGTKANLYMAERVITLYYGRETSLHTSTDGEKVIYTSSDPSVATVDENGVVKAVNGGECTITAKTEKTNESVSTVIKVEKNCWLIILYYIEQIFAFFK